MKTLRIISYLICIFFTYSNSAAIINSRPTPTDSRIRVMVFNPNDVFKFTGFYGYQSSIELGESEEVVSISMGDTSGWQIVPSGNRIFMKPIALNATTNMTLITNNHTYFFELYGEEATDIRDPNMIFNVKFLYPELAEAEAISASSSIGSSGVSSNSGPNLSAPEKLNFNYSISGSEEMAPVKIFDDGSFTYLQFREKNSEVPAIFAVDEDLRESMVNYRVDTANPNILVIEQVFQKLSLRNGKKIVCVYNEAFQLDFF